MKKFKDRVIKETDAIHIMGHGVSTTGVYGLGDTGLISIGSLHKKQKLGTKVKEKNINKNSIHSYIAFCNVESVDQMISNLKLLKKHMKKRK